MKKENGQMRLKILLGILAFSIALVGILFYIYRPFSQAACTFSLTATPSTLTADGISKSTLLANACTAKTRIYFYTNLGTLSASQTTTDAYGKAKVYLNSNQAGTATPYFKIGQFKFTMGAQTKVTFIQSGTVPINPTLFSDNFSTGLGQWQVMYNGYGTVAVENGELSESPKASTQPAETHAAMTVGGNAAWTDYIYNLKMKTISQLRTGSTPNPWEVGWVVFRYRDDNNFYYLINKPNGVELGKVLNGTQYYLSTPTSPKLTLGQWNNYKIVLKGNTIKAYIDGVLVASATDILNPILTGKIGLYDEDAHVHFDNVVVTQN